MNEQKHQFISLALTHHALKFGEFILKSGRKSPYFFNAGAFHSGEALSILGKLYADLIIKHQLSFDLLFGPAYKGIPLVSAVATSLYINHNINVNWCFNRKEAKDHGEGGMIVGAPLQGKILLIDDVMTAGTAIRESITLISHSNAEPSGVLIMLDRQEKGNGDLSAVQEFEEQYNLPVFSIITMNDLISFLESSNYDKNALEMMYTYREKYGITLA